MKLCIRRYLAYLFDYILIWIVFSLLVSFIYPSNCHNYQAKTMAILKLNQSYLSEVISVNEYSEKYQIEMYETTRENAIFTLVKIVLLLSYFGYYQYKKGQTLGQKLLKIIVQGEKLTLKTYLLRIFILDNMLFTIIELLSVFALKEQTYYGLFQTMVTLATLCNFINIILLLFTTNQQGIHDRLTNTHVKLLTSS